MGALVCGSYITGNPTKRSDIDVHIILSDDVEWRERGNKRINGFLIEYFANPPKQIRKYFQQDFQNKRTMSMVQLMTGKILFDNTGILNELKIEAEHWLNNEYDELNKTIVEIKKYSLWDSFDNLKDCFEQKRVDFHFVYFNSFQRVSKHPLKEVKASGGCHGIGKEFFVQAQSRFQTQLCRGIIDCIS